MIVLRTVGARAGCGRSALPSSRALSALAQAAPPADRGRGTAPAPVMHETGTRFGVVIRVSGEVTAARASDEHRHPLHAGDVIYVGEHLRTGANGEALVKTDDAGMIGARPNTDFYAEQFAATAAPSDAMALRLVRGSLRVITGWIGRLTPKNYHVTTPTATIGVRGTDHEPYVLSTEAAAATPYRPGSYDKVNSGRTFITANGRELDIDAGQVGVAPDAPANEVKTRGLMTLALPYLLDHVPDFYRGGKFEDEMDAYSRDADATSLQEHQKLEGSAAPAPACAPLDIARDWVARFDEALVRRDAPAIMSQFAEDASVQVVVRDHNGASVTSQLTRAELAKSSAQATAGLTDYKQTRDTLDAALMPGQAPGACQRIYVDSQVTEQGRMNNQPYRIQSREEYVLERRDERWLAVHAVTTQR